MPIYIAAWPDKSVSILTSVGWDNLLLDLDVEGDGRFAKIAKFPSKFYLEIINREGKPTLDSVGDGDWKPMKWLQWSEEKQGFVPCPAPDFAMVEEEKEEEEEDAVEK